LAARCSETKGWLKFANVTRKFDIEPIVHTVDNANYPKDKPY
jgi:hypothetical protein